MLTQHSRRVKSLEHPSRNQRFSVGKGPLWHSIVCTHDELTGQLMPNQEPPNFFDRQHASSDDKQRAGLAPMRDALHLFVRMVLSELPADAKILCVGAGTGPELIYLAQAFPRWHFTAVEPAAPMLDVCRRRAEEAGVASRCTFHEGYLDSLPDSYSFDAATCILVSQFLMEPEERRNFFLQIAARLRPNGYLVSADLASDMSAPAYKSLFEVWARALRFSEIPAKEVEKRLAGCGRKVAVLPPQEVESIISSSGFDAPILFFQALLIHAWYTQKAATD